MNGAVTARHLSEATRKGHISRRLNISNDRVIDKCIYAWREWGAVSALLLGLWESLPGLKPWIVEFNLRLYALFACHTLLVGSRQRGLKLLRYHLLLRTVDSPPWESEWQLSAVDVQASGLSGLFKQAPTMRFIYSKQHLAWAGTPIPSLMQDPKARRSKSTRASSS